MEVAPGGTGKGVDGLTKLYVYVVPALTVRVPCMGAPELSVMVPVTDPQGVVPVQVPEVPGGGRTVQFWLEYDPEREPLSQERVSDTQDDPDGTDGDWYAVTGAEACATDPPQGRRQSALQLSVWTCHGFQAPGSLPAFAEQEYSRCHVRDPVKPGPQSGRTSV